MRVNASPCHCREAFVPDLYGLRTISLQGVLSGGGKSILGHGQLYELALHRVGSGASWAKENSAKSKLRPMRSTILGMAAPGHSIARGAIFAESRKVRFPSLGLYPQRYPSALSLVDTVQ